MMDKTVEKDRIDEMLNTVMEVARGDYSVQVELSGKNDELDSLAMGLNMMIDDLQANTVELSYATNRIEEILNIIQRVARGDYATACEPSEENNIFDALGMGVNMMIDDVRTSHEDLNRQKNELLAFNKDLQESLAKIKTLSGLLPICAWCKKIRDDEGYWKDVEQYISEHTKAELTHSICPECFNKVCAKEASKENNSNKVS
jgi:signal transduction histidine kinase